MEYRYEFGRGDENQLQVTVYASAEVLSNILRLMRTNFPADEEFVNLRAECVAIQSSAGPGFVTIDIRGDKDYTNFLTCLFEKVGMVYHG